MNVIGISSQNTTTLETFIQDQGITFPVLQDYIGDIDNYQDIYGLYTLMGGTSPYPRDFLIDREGIIRYAATEYDPNGMINLLENLLDEPFLGVNNVPLPSSPKLAVYPNPFNPTTIIQFDLPASTVVRLTIYDLQGREILRLVNQQMEAGYHQIQWHSRDQKGRELPSGIYIARLVTPDYTKSIKIVLLK